MATRTDYIPHSHTQFFVWQNNFFEYLQKMYETFGITEQRLAALGEIRVRYTEAFAKASSKTTANSADRLLRNETEAEYVTAIRVFTAECLRYNPKVSDADRVLLGITVRDRTYTRVAVPTSHPVLRVSLFGISCHKVHFKDSELESRHKPKGVKECEIWYAFGNEMPKHDNEWHYAGSSANGSLLMEFEFSERGKQVYYQARWVNTRGKKGGWGNTASAYIA
ncbi:MAG: hypothetical protein LBR75_05680 [Prevotellaceae bacterium]|jgi:hypothetical protein|nr:hypothetical protein [Prevotellaceae bacterium]